MTRRDTRHIMGSGYWLDLCISIGIVAWNVIVYIFVPVILLALLVKGFLIGFRGH